MAASALYRARGTKCVTRSRNATSTWGTAFQPQYIAKEVFSMHHVPLRLVRIRLWIVVGMVPDSPSEACSHGAAEH